MTSTEFDDRRLAKLRAPRRNRYYAGKLLARVPRPASMFVRVR